MEVSHWQQAIETSIQPVGPLLPLALWAVAIAAGVLGDADVAAGGTGIDVSAQSCCSAGTQVSYDSGLLARDELTLTIIVGVRA